MQNKKFKKAYDQVELSPTQLQNLLDHLLEENKTLPPKRYRIQHGTLVAAVFVAIFLAFGTYITNQLMPVSDQGNNSSAQNPQNPKVISLTPHAKETEEPIKHSASSTADDAGVLSYAYITDINETTASVDFCQLTVAINDLERYARIEKEAGDTPSYIENEDTTQESYSFSKQCIIYVPNESEATSTQRGESSPATPSEKVYKGLSPKDFVTYVNQKQVDTVFAEITTQKDEITEVIVHELP